MSAVPQATSPEALAIVGPTASGKTALALDVAESLGGEIISMDSRQVYRGLDIATAKATPRQRAAAPHHGLDLLDPGERFGAGRFARYAREKIAEIKGRGRVPLLVGGTGFFLRALTHPIFREPEHDPEQRSAVRAFLTRLDIGLLIRWLRALDPASAERLTHGGGVQRMQRALEIALLTGRPLSWWQRNGPPEAEPLRPLIFVLDPPRELLAAAIDARVDEMVGAGLVEALRGLAEAGWRDGDPGMNATGYPELLWYLHGELPLDAALDRIRANTRAYARRQRTWFRHQLPPGAVWLDASRPRNDLSEDITSLWHRMHPDGRGLD
ncbi:MAG: tRNA (adenosine(37)-N6)-dimethylallyltransferase MiaA [Gemmatimonadota bacterium]|nr:tRNA (adenosine(37)-N6)-dimethylallyltransferase MiaA [Gemmatimonadota bacterium]